MKPFVVYIDVNTNEITLTKKEFEKFLKEAYEQGHDEGYNKGLASSRSNWWNYPLTTTTATNEIRYGTTSPSEPNPITITCKTNENPITVNDIVSNLFNSVGD